MKTAGKPGIWRMVSFLAYSELILGIAGILLRAHIGKLIKTPEDNKLVFQFLFLFLVIMEFVFLMIILRRKRGVIGIPVFILRGYFLLISPFPSGIGRFLCIFAVISILARVLESVYLYKNTSHEKGLEGVNKPLLFSIELDLISFVSFWIL